MISGFIVKVPRDIRVLSREVSFKPVQTVGPITVGESDGNVALTTVTSLGEEWIWVIPIAILFLPIVLWILGATIWWWATSDLKFADLSKLIGLLSPYFGVVAEALIK